MNAEFSLREPSPADEPDRAPANPPSPDFTKAGRASRSRRKRQKRSTALVASEAPPRESGRRLYRRALTYFFSSFGPIGHKSVTDES